MRDTGFNNSHCHSYQPDVLQVGKAILNHSEFSRSASWTQPPWTGTKWDKLSLLRSAAASPDQQKGPPDPSTVSGNRWLVFQFTTFWCSLLCNKDHKLRCLVSCFMLQEWALNYFLCRLRWEWIDINGEAIKSMMQFMTWKKKKLVPQHTCMHICMIIICRLPSSGIYK